MTAFTVQLSFQGKITTLSNVTTSTSEEELYRQARRALHLIEEHQSNEGQPDEQPSSPAWALKLLHKGKKLDETSPTPAFDQIPTKTPKIMVLATRRTEIVDLQSKRSDPTIRGFDQEKKTPSSASSSMPQQQHWKPLITQQDKNYKFGRLEACTWQSFGHRPTDQTPHAFAAMHLLEKLATDPGILALMRDRELIVNTLAEMDPIDDRIMQKSQQQQQGTCLLGYNTNGGLRIDLKLRTDDLQGFRPYSTLVNTLIHELSHNWVSEHNLLFWTNVGHMRIEYLSTHAYLAQHHATAGSAVARLAGLDPVEQLSSVYETVMMELQYEMRQHGLHPAMIAPALQQHVDQWKPHATTVQMCASFSTTGVRLGGPSDDEFITVAATHTAGTTDDAASLRHKARQAAERRARDQQPKSNHPDGK